MMPFPSPFEKPPEGMKAIYKRYQKMTTAELIEEQDIVDFVRDPDACSKHNLRILRTIDPRTLQSSLSSSGIGAQPLEHLRLIQVYASLTVPGLHLIPSLLSEDVQTALLSRLLHRDLAEKSHRTNIYKHYNIPYHLCNAESNQARADEGSSVHMYSSSFFNCDPNSPITFEPIDPTMHKPLTIRQFLNKKLRWITLGGQYDWTEKSYPKDKPPEFPADEAAMIQTAFPEMRPEAAIVNIYSPGDTLSLHRDLSEEADQGLVSISMGCDGIFIVGLESTSPEGATSLAIRLRSGDAVYMSRSARWAWHGVPRIVPGSCPKWLRAWPVQGKPSAAGQDPDNQSSTAFEAWRGWMETKRINLNVRQMYP